MINRQPINNDLITYEKFEKSQQVKEVGCLLDYNNFKKYYKMIAIDFRKQQALNADPKAIKQNSFTGNLEQQAAMFFIIEKAKGTVLDFP